MTLEAVTGRAAPRMATNTGKLSLKILPIFKKPPSRGAAQPASSRWLRSAQGPKPGAGQEALEKPCADARSEKVTLCIQARASVTGQNKDELQQVVQLAARRGLELPLHVRESLFAEPAPQSLCARFRLAGFWIDRGGTFPSGRSAAPSGGWWVRKVLSEQPRQAGRMPAVAADAHAAWGWGAGPARLPNKGRWEEVGWAPRWPPTPCLRARAPPTLAVLMHARFADCALDRRCSNRPDLFALWHRRTGSPVMRQGAREGEGRWRPMARNWPLVRLDADLERRSARPGRRKSAGCAVALLHAAADPARSGSWATGRASGLSTSTRWCSFPPVPCAPRRCPAPRPPSSEASRRPCWRPIWSGCTRAGAHSGRVRVMQSERGIDRPGTASAPRHNDRSPGPPVGLVVRQSSWRGGSTPIRRFFPTWAPSTECVSIRVPPGAGKWKMERGEWRLQRKLGLEAAGGDRRIAWSPRLRAERLPIHTVGGRGGSQASTFGPAIAGGAASAGADPGPACYRSAGGPLTITDAQPVAGTPAAGRPFPAVFPAPAEIRARSGAVKPAVSRSCPSGSPWRTGTGEPTPEARPKEPWRSPTGPMAEAIRRIRSSAAMTIRRCTLVCYGGAGGSTRCASPSRWASVGCLLHPLRRSALAYGIGPGRPAAAARGGGAWNPSMRRWSTSAGSGPSAPG